MKALVATVNHILFVDLQTHKIKIIESHRPEYYGISWRENSDTLILSHSGLANDSLLDIESYINSEKGYLSFGEAQTQCFLSQPHQILCAPNNWIITTNTGRNCITLYEPTNGFYKDIRINDIYWDRLGKKNTCGEHFNSVYLKNNRLYVLAHRFQKTSHVLEFSYPDCTLIQRYEVHQKSGLHNIWVDDIGNMIACHSEAGELIEIKSNETLWTSTTSHYTRGLAATADFILIGDSELTSRENRKTSHTDLWVIDRKTFNTMDYLPLGPYGAVHEIRLLDMVDEAHHGKTFSGVGNLEQYAETLQQPLAERRKIKLQINQNQRHQQLQQINCIISGWLVNKEGWVAPKNKGLALGIIKEIPGQHFTASLDYSFLEPSESNISLVVGYRGASDTNMIAILISRSAEHTARVYLWINTNGNWEAKAILFRKVSKEGRLSVTRQGHQLIITCNKLPAVIRSFTSEELDGAVGVRCLGAQFKNFSVTANTPETLKENSKFKKTVWKKLKEFI